MNGKNQQSAKLSKGSDFSGFQYLNTKLIFYLKYLQNNLVKVK